MESKMKSVFVFVLVLYGTLGQDDVFDDIGPTTQAPGSLKGGRQECIVMGEAGACVKSRQYCKTPHTGKDSLHWRSSTNNTSCPNDGVCCKLSDVVPTNIDTTSTVSPTLLSRLTPTGNAVECGVQKLQTVPNFVKTREDEADPGEFPWTVNLMIQKNQLGDKITYSFTGTGSLIHDRVVLTAAHVFNNKDTGKLMAVFGEHDQKKKILRKKALKVAEVVVHNKFDRSDGNYNFALVFLTSSAMKGLPHVGTVCLPPADFVASAGASCVFSGWGFDSALNPINQLTKTKVPMMTHSTCEQRLQQNPQLGPGFHLLASFTCAGGELDRDICGGGGGSPLVCPIEGKNRYVQTGIVSWVLAGCGVDGSPAVFANVAVARPWIDQQMADRHYSTASYTY